MGQDLEDGTLDDADLSWNSDIDGPLGMGHLVHPSLLSVGTHNITLTASDPDGQIGTATVVIHVGYQNPIITCPPNQTVDTDSNQCSAVVNYPAPTVTDNLAGVTMSCSPASGTMFLIDTTTVTCTATDVDDNTAGCSFTVSVVDNTPPTITCPANQTVNATSPSGANVTYLVPVASDNCSVVSVTSLPASGSLFAVGATTVNSQAIDIGTNTNTCTFTVQVKGAAGQITDLIALVNGLPGVKAATKNSLVVKLNAALSALNANNKPTACARLQDFINLAQAQYGKKELSAAQATLLSKEATRIRAVIGCS